MAAYSTLTRSVCVTQVLAPGGMLMGTFKAFAMEKSALRDARSHGRSMLQHLLNQGWTPNFANVPNQEHVDHMKIFKPDHRFHIN